MSLRHARAGSIAAIVLLALLAASSGCRRRSTPAPTEPGASASTLARSPATDAGATSVASSREVLEIAVADGTACALLADGSVRCWGSNRARLVGDATVLYRRAPTPIDGLGPALHVALAGNLACAVVRGGDLVCWGGGGVPIGDDGGAPVLADAPEIPRVVAHGADGVALGSFAGCILGHDRTVACWGVDAHGAALRPIAGAAGAVQIAADTTVACARDDGGHVACWDMAGGFNAFGELGDGTATRRHTAERVAGLDDAIDVAVGAGSACAVRRSGAVVCWGREIWTEGVGPGVVAVPHPRPAEVRGLDGASRVTVSERAVCAIVAGDVRCVGDASDVLFASAHEERFALRGPTRIPELRAVVDLASAGGSVACARTASHDAVCWGVNLDREVEDDRRGAYHTTPTRIDFGAPRACTPSCDGKECGDDGCGSTCLRPATRGCLCVASKCVSRCAPRCK